MKTTRFSILFLLVAVTNIAAQWTKTADHLIGQIPGVCCGFGCITFRDGIAWAGRTNALWKSLDSGQTWQQASTGMDAVITQIDFFNEFTGLVATRNGLYITNDQGKPLPR